MNLLKFGKTVVRMTKCKGCGLDGEIWRLKEGYCMACREAGELDKPNPNLKTNLVGFYEDDRIYDILEGIRVAIVDLTKVIKSFKKKELGWSDVLDIVDKRRKASCESISGGHQFKNGKCEMCNTKKGSDEK